MSPSNEQEAAVGGGGDGGGGGGDGGGGGGEIGGLANRQLSPLSLDRDILTGTSGVSRSNSGATCTTTSCMMQGGCTLYML